MFREGAEIRIAGYQPYKVVNGDTLAGIARSLQPEGAPPPPPLTVDQLSLDLAGATGLFPDSLRLSTWTVSAKAWTTGTSPASPGTPVCA